MYRVLLVDDEVLIREAISENIHWNDHGYELIGTCKNGKEAIEKMQNDSPDLVLTDICMPYVDGIEVAKYVYENCPRTKVIIISGYEEFDYAKSAVKYQVLDYILKPVTMAELSEKLESVRSILDEVNEQEKNLEKIRSAYKTNLPIMRGRYLTSLFHGAVYNGNIDAKIAEYQIDLQKDSYMAAIIVLDDASVFHEKAEDASVGLANFAVYNVTAELLEAHRGCIAFQDAEGQTLMLFSGTDNTGKHALEICEEVQETLNTVLKIDCTIGIGRTVHALKELPQTYQEALRSLEFRFQLGGNQIIYSKRLQEGAAHGVDIGCWTKVLSDAVKRGEMREIHRIVYDFAQAVRDTMAPKSRSIFYVQSLIIGLLGTIDATTLNENNLFDEEKELLAVILAKNHLSEVAEEMEKYCRRVSDSLQDMKEGFCKKQAVQALEYIDRNYGDSDISLNTVCNYLAMSTSYFSSVFKSYTGETFIEALTKKRISRAKEMLETTSKKAYEIADEVGYSDPHYFSSTFKKMTGMTPTEYARKTRKR